MGQILSSATVYAVAYLTERGRQLLFDPMASQRFANNMDAFKITRFSLSDPDVNYYLDSGIILETGDIPNISGKNEDYIKGTIINREFNLVSADGRLDTGSGNGTGFGDTPVDYYAYEVDETLNTLILK